MLLQYLTILISICMDNSALIRDKTVGVNNNR